MGSRQLAGTTETTDPSPDDYDAHNPSVEHSSLLGPRPEEVPTSRESFDRKDD